MRLDNVLTNTKTVSGMALIKAMCEGQEDPAALAQLVHPSCKKTKAEIQALLTGHWTDTMRLEIRTSYAIHQTLQEHIAKLDAQLDTVFRQQTQALPLPAKEDTPKPRKPKANTPRLPLELYAQQLLGVDLSQIPGFGRDALLGLLGEVGQAIDQFDSAQAFAKWLALTPNNRSSGGKTLSKKTLKNKSSLPTTFRMVANSIGNMTRSNPLASFFQRIAYKAGRITAITATARKVAVLVYTLVKTKQPYDASRVGRNAEEVKALQVKRMRKNMAKFGITGAELGLTGDFVSS